MIRSTTLHAICRIRLLQAIHTVIPRFAATADPVAHISARRLFSISSPSSTAKPPPPRAQARDRDRHKKPTNALVAYHTVHNAYQSHLRSSPVLSPAQWSALCSPLLAKPSVAQLDTWMLVQKAASDPENPSPLVLSTLNDVLALYSRSARKGDHAIVNQIVRYCRTHFATHPRTLAMADVDPLFFKVMVASEYDAGKALPKATRAVERWMQVHEPEPEHVAFYLSLVCKHASKAHVEQLVTALKVGGASVDSPAVASALMALYSRTRSPNLGVHVWDKCVTRDPPVMSAAMAASYCDLVGFHWRKLDDFQARLTTVHAGLAAGAPPFTLDLAGNANVWTSLLEAVIRANLPQMVVPILHDMQGRLPGRAGVRKAALTVRTMMEQKQGEEQWDKEVKDEIAREVDQNLRPTLPKRRPPAVQEQKPRREPRGAREAQEAGAADGRWRGGPKGKDER